MRTRRGEALQAQRVASATAVLATYDNFLLAGLKEIEGFSERLDAFPKRELVSLQGSRTRLLHIGKSSILPIPIPATASSKITRCCYTEVASVKLD